MVSRCDFRTIGFVSAAGAPPKIIVPEIAVETRMRIIESAQHRRAQGIVWGKPCMMPDEKFMTLEAPAILGYQTLTGYSAYRLPGQTYGEVPYFFREWLETAADTGDHFPQPLPAPTPLNCVSFVLSELVSARLLTAQEVHLFYRAEDEKYGYEDIDDENEGDCTDPRYCSSIIGSMDGPGEWITAQNIASDAHQWADIVMAVDTQSEVPMYTVHVGFFTGIGQDPNGSGRTGVLLSDWEGSVRRTSTLNWCPLGENNLYRRVPLEGVIARVKEKAAWYAANAMDV